MATFVKKAVNYSLKNIPFPSNESFMKNLIHQTEKFLTRMRWKALFFKKKEEDSENESDSDEEEYEKRTYGFNTSNSPPAINELSSFEQDVWDLVDNVKFTDKKTYFQKKMDSDIKDISKSKNVFMKSDKTGNLYETSPENYKKLLKKNITKDYKKSNVSDMKETNLEAKAIAEKLKIDDRVEVLQSSEAFITLKDHKQNFQNQPQCRLINPAKSEIGIISQRILQRVNPIVREKSGLKQWVKTEDAITWFENISDKKDKEFVQCDIVNFYPSITENLMEEALTFAENYTSISNIEKKAIRNARKTLLFSEKEPWVKKDTPFDVSMGAFDGAEICELVGLMILYKLKEVVPNIDFGLYRDDGLGVYKSTRGCHIDSARKKIIDTFKNFGLDITIQLRLHEVDFLDVTFNLHEDIYKPFRKPNSKPVYIHVNSNHPPHIKKQIPKMIGKRLSSISKNEKIFDEIKNDYNEALSSSGYKEKIAFSKTSQTSTRAKNKTRKRKIIWYNPPYSDSITTKFGRDFLAIIDKHFGKDRKDNFHKIFNRKTIKVSYSCNQNMENIIKRHNHKVLNNTNRTHNANDKKCSCQKKDLCPLKGDCLQETVVYKATVSTNSGKQTYIGSTELTFKDRFYGHSSDFRHKNNRVKTTLASHIWDCKDKQTEYNVSWEILRHCSKYKGGKRKCDLCLTEKLFILKNKENPLNKRTELMGKCRHLRKFKLQVIK